MTLDHCPPLLVATQSIDIQGLDFRSPLNAKRNVTYVEGTNQYLFVGFTSGTVYVFQRDNLGFKFIIPFKGGKVCHISCSQDESDVAISSIRGTISLYRIYTEDGRDWFKHLYTLNHHIENEVTEMSWSINGRFLFIGDSRGIISQVDVGCLGEFPRPIASKIILRVEFRVMQLSFLFPYLLISTLGGSFLCDIESESFVRIQNSFGDDLKSSGGLLYVDSMGGGNLELACLIGEQGSPHLNRKLILNEEEKITRRKTEPATGFCLQNIPLFNPKCPIPSSSATDEDPTEFSLRKLYLFEEDSLLITASTNRLLILHPQSMRILLWTDQFSHIHTIKLISNYLFIWNGSRKLDVIALTDFRSYGEQLFKANLFGVLQNWVQYSLSLIKPKKEDSDISNAFKHLVGSTNVPKDEFFTHIAPLLPFELFPVNLVQSALAKLLESSKKCLNDEKLDSIMLNFIQFYRDIGCTFPTPLSAEISLSKLNAGINTFTKQPQIINCTDDISSKDYKELEQIISHVISHLVSTQLNFSANSELVDTLKPALFLSSFANKSEIIKWFARIGINNKELEKDTLFADHLILLAPLLTPNTYKSLALSTYNQFGYFTWFVTREEWGNEGIRKIFGLLLKGDSRIEAHLSRITRQFISTLTFDLLNSEPLVTQYLDWIVTSFYLSSSSEKEALAALSSAFLSLHVSPEEERSKMWTLCEKNHSLLLMFYEASLQLHSTQSLCFCRLPNEFKRERINPAQRRIDGIILGLLKHFGFEPEIILEFAMKRSLIEDIIQNPKLVNEETKVQLILRTCSCSLMKRFKLSSTEWEMLISSLEYIHKSLLVNSKSNCIPCQGCSEFVYLDKNRLLSWDCLAFWIYSNFSDNSLRGVDRFIQFIAKSPLNEPNRLSTRFYQYMINSLDEGKVEKATLDCQIFHSETSMNSFLHLL